MKKKFDLRGELNALSPEARARVLERTQGTRDHSPAQVRVPMARIARDGPLAASFAQERLWFLAQLDPNAPTYNVPIALRVRGPLSADALARSITEIVRRHEVLRTTLEEVDGSLQPIVHAAMDVPLTIVAAEDEAHLREQIQAEIHRPFDLARGPLVRSTLLRLASDVHVFILVMHHIVTDGWSVGVVERELRALYEAFQHGRPSPLAELPLQYADFAAWQRTAMSGDALERQVTYWKKQLRGAPTAVELPTDRPRPATKQYRGSSVSIALPPGIGQAVADLAQRENATTFMVMLAAFNILLARHTGQTDVVVGCPIANRTHTELEGMIGFFVNTLALRTKLDGHPTFHDVIQRVKESSLGAYDHQDVPFEKLVEELHPPRDMSRTPIVQVMFAHLRLSPNESTFMGTSTSAEAFALEVSKFDMTLYFEERGADVRAALEYDAALFDRSTAERFAERYSVLLADAVAHPELPIQALEAMTTGDCLQIESQRGGSMRTVTKLDYGVTSCVHELFEARVARSPEAIAVSMAGRELTYGELNEESNRLAAYLQRRGVGIDTLVGVRAERSLEMLIAILAVMKAGGAYLPLDPTYPRDRLLFMLSDSGAPVLLTTAEVTDDLSVETTIHLHRDAAEWAAESPDNPKPVATEGLAYVIYTSGSTGRPKATGIAHRQLTHFAREAARLCGTEPGWRCGQFASLSFDAHVWEIWPALISGASVNVIPDDVRADPAALMGWLVGARLDHLFTPTAIGEELLKHDWKNVSLRVLSFGGEGMHGVPQRAYPFRHIINCYGPTECTCVSTVAFVPAGETRPGIGTALDGVTPHVLDAKLDRVLPGAVGEICIGGDLVGRGYVRLAQLTAERFVPDPFSASSGARMYRTGDLGRIRSDGTLECVGRTDDQVKIRGQRVELGEIESVLAAREGVRSVVVVAHEHTDGDKRLVAYVAASPGSLLSSGDTRALDAELRKLLPRHMVPSALVVLDALPLTVNGKVDRKALPAPDFRSTAAYVAPRNAREELLCTAFAEVLALPRVGIQDDFFSLGGHSMLAMRLIARIRKTLGIEIRVGELMANPTVAGLSTLIEGTGRSAGPAMVRSDDAPLAASFVQELHSAWESERAPSCTWNAAGRLDMHGPLDEGRLRQAVRSTLEGQEALRWIPTHGSGLRVCAWSDVPFTVHDLRGATDTEVAAFCSARGDEPFTMDGRPLIRFDLIRRANERHVLLTTWHAFVHDPSRQDMILNEILNAFEKLFAPLSIRYRDYVAWEREWFEQRGREDVATLRSSLEGARPLELTDMPRKGRVAAEAFDEEFLLSKQVGQRIHAHAQSLAVSPFILFVTLTAALLSRWGKTDDVTFITSMNLRNLHTETERLLGRFQNWIPLRVSTAGKPSFAELVVRCRKAVSFAQNYGTAPLAKVLDMPDPFNHPLARVVLNVPLIGASSALPTRRLGELTVTRVEVDLHSGARNDLALLLGTVDDRVIGLVRGAKELFFEQTISGWRSELSDALETLAPDSRITLAPGRDPSA